jgi:hypothetical protein
MPTIFVSIASYRDPELLPTLRDMFANAKYPNDIRVGIGWQRDPSESLEEFYGDTRFRVLDIPYQSARGACWARYAIQQLYDGEDYYMQLDSHHRFVEDWDEKCINMIQQLQAKGHEKPLLTGYISSFNPRRDPQDRIQTPWRMVFDRFIPEGAVFFLPESIDNFRELTEPEPARFYSAHFMFTVGSWGTEVMYDPEYYFHGEEISLAARSFTWGYDLFHPHMVIAWHEYTREGRTKCWDDDPVWVKRNDHCHARNRRLFSMDGNVYNPEEFGKYGFGPVRSVREYEKYAGLDFKTRRVHQDNYKKGANYLIPDFNNQFRTEEEFENELVVTFKHFLDIWHEDLPERDYEFIVVALHGPNDETLYRKDWSPNEFTPVVYNDKTFKVFLVEAEGISKPNSWVVWPFSKSKGWGKRITGEIK